MDKDFIVQALDAMDYHTRLVCCALCRRWRCTASMLVTIDDGVSVCPDCADQVRRDDGSISKYRLMRMYMKLGRRPGR